MKKKAVFLGNCQNSGIITFLNKSEEFRDQYDIKVHVNYEILRNVKCTPVEDIKNCDLFVYQPLPPEYGCYSTDPNVSDSIGSLLKEDCIKISFPYTYCSSLWPIIQSGHNSNRWFGWEPIHKLKILGYDNSGIIDLYKSNQIDWDYQNRFDSTLKILEEKESLTDIKISKFIRDRISTDLTFLIPQHPTSIVFLEMSSQIHEILFGRRLDMSLLNDDNESKIEDSTYGRADCRFPIHKSALEFYKFNFSPESPDSNSFYLDRLTDYLSRNPGLDTPEI
jgi:hypothetical protein